MPLEREQLDYYMRTEVHPHSLYYLQSDGYRTIFFKRKMFCDLG